MDKKIQKEIQKIRKMIHYISKEYNIVMTNYEDDKIYNRCLPCHVDPSLNKLKQIEIKNKIDKIFLPNILDVSEKIDKGLIYWDNVADVITPSDDIHTIDGTKKVIYESIDRLYIIKSIKSNLTIEFIIMTYLFFERQVFLMNMENEYEKINQFTRLNDSIESIEKNYNIEINKECKDKFELYRNVINVYKHGDGYSYDWLKKNYEDYINSEEIMANDPTHLFKMDRINLKDLCLAICNFCNELDEKIK